MINWWLQFEGYTWFPTARVPPRQAEALWSAGVMRGLTDRELLHRDIATLRQTITDRWQGSRTTSLSSEERRSLRRAIVHCIADLGSVLVRLDQVSDLSYGAQELKSRD